MSETPEYPSPAATRDRSIQARRAARLVKARREQRIVGLLNSGVSIPEIAARQGVTEKRMRAVVRDILARRMPEPPEQFLALQVSRLNEALLVAYGAMSGGNLKAVDRVVKIVRELDRYHGFVAAERRSSASEPRLETSAESPLALAAPRACAEKAPQTAEMLENAPGPGSAEANPSPQDADPEPSEAPSARMAADDETSVEAPPTGPQMAPEAVEVLESALKRGAALEGANPDEASAETLPAIQAPLLSPPTDSGLEFTRGALSASPPPLVGEEQGGGSRCPAGFTFDNLAGRRDPPPQPAPTSGGGCANIVDSTGLQQALTAPQRLDSNETAPGEGEAQKTLTQLERELASGIYAPPSFGPDGRRRVNLRATLNGVMAA